MQRRTFDLLVSVGGLVLGVVLIVVGFVFRANAEFAKDSVRAQLAAQRISFPAASALSPQEKEQPNVVKYAGEQVRTGDQAEVYANQFIALHLRENLGGKTYAELSSAARANPTDEELAAKVQTAFRGETLRGLLLTTYAFWTLGEKAEQASWATFGGAAALLLLALLGLWHHARTPKQEVMFHEFALRQPPTKTARRSA